MLKRIPDQTFQKILTEKLGNESHDSSQQWHAALEHIRHELPAEDARFEQLRAALYVLDTGDGTRPEEYYDQLTHAIEALSKLFPPQSQYANMKGLGPMLWKHELSQAEQRAYLLKELNLSDMTTPIEEQRYRMIVLRAAEGLGKFVRFYQQSLEKAA